MPRQYQTLEETQIARIMNVLKTESIDYWSNMREFPENLIIRIRRPMGTFTRRNQITDDLILKSVDMFIRLFEDESSRSSLGNIADDSDEEGSSMDLTRRSFNAPGWQRLPASPPTPIIYRERHVALPRPENPTDQSTTDPETDATYWSNKSYAQAPQSPDYDFEAVNAENNPQLVPQMAPQMAPQVDLQNNTFLNPEIPDQFVPNNYMESTRLDATIILVPIPNLYGEEPIPLTLQEESEFANAISSQLSNGSAELTNQNAFVQLHEE